MVKCDKCKSDEVVVTLLSDWSQFLCKCSACGSTSAMAIGEDDYEKFSKMVK